MAESSRQLPRTLWVGFSLLSGLLGLAWLLSIAESRRLHQHPLSVIGAVADFTLTNQDSHVTTLADLSNHVWVADIIFTRCAGPCPRMTAQMKSLQDSLPPTSDAKLVTLTTDPDNDTPSVMKRYGERFNADFNRWMFLTGTKRDIAGLAADSLKLSAVPIPEAQRQNDADLFIHTTIFVLVDRHGKLRGHFETMGDGIDWTNSVRPSVLAAIRKLEAEK
jgi:cytochrome oxidase Cu insertion factor (SCO1/SenC/PrrC family)